MHVYIHIYAVKTKSMCRIIFYDILRFCIPFVQVSLAYREKQRRTEKLAFQVSFNILRTAALSTFAFHKSQISISGEAYRKRITRNANARKRISGEESAGDDTRMPWTISPRPPPTNEI